MTTPGEITRKVRQLDNDVQAINDLLKDIAAVRRTQAGQLDELAAGQNRLGGVQLRQNNRLDEFAATQEQHTDALRDLAATQLRQGNRLDELAGTQEQHTATLAEHSTVLGQHTATLADHGGKLDTIIDLLRGDRPAGG